MKPVIIKHGRKYAMADHVRTGYGAILKMMGKKQFARVAGVEGFLIQTLGRLPGLTACSSLKRAGIIRPIGLNPKNRQQAIWLVKRVEVERLNYGHTKYAITTKKHGHRGARKKKRICSSRGVVQSRITHGACKHSVISERLMRMIAKEAGFPPDVESVDVVVHLVYNR